MRSKINILIPDGGSALGLAVLRCLAHAPGCRVHLLSNKPCAPALFSRRKASFQHQPLDAGEELEKIATAARRVDADVILPVTEPMIRLVSALRPELLRFSSIAPTPSLQCFDRVSDKWALSRFLSERSLPCPATVWVGPEVMRGRKSPGIEFPLLLKPQTGNGGRGILLFKDADELLRFSLKTDLGICYIAQTFVEGYDIDCSVLCAEGRVLAYTIQQGLLSSFDRFGPPPVIEFVKNEAVLDVATQAIRSLGWSGIAHIDLRMDAKTGRPSVIEINPRFWGSLLGSLHAGVNFPYLSCLAGLGIAFPLPAYRTGRFIWQYRIAAQYLLRESNALRGIGSFFRDTNWRYMLTDPFPEMYKIVRKKLLDLRGRPEEDGKQPVLAGEKPGSLGSLM